MDIKTDKKENEQGGGFRCKSRRFVAATMFKGGYANPLPMDKTGETSAYWYDRDENRRVNREGI